jgi:hypothetical protein
MTGRCAGDGVPMRFARFRASVEHHRERSDRQSEHGCDRNSCRPKHRSILHYRDRRTIERGSAWSRGQADAVAAALLFDAAALIVTMVTPFRHVELHRGGRDLAFCRHAHRIRLGGPDCGFTRSNGDVGVSRRRGQEQKGTVLRFRRRRG